MTEPSPSRPVPGPPRSGPSAEPAEEALASEEQETPTADDATATDPERFAGLGELPVADHVAVFEAEHSRLQDELSTIDQV